ncbi:VOC family protein [Candidatus Woesearchaeota archaeon]|nr:VOC family protein [Candidatus Woesearchaeota archaeon]
MAKLGHVHIKVRNLKRAEKFYTELLGFNITEKVSDDYSFLTLGKSHHDLALQNAGENAELPKQNQVGLYHFAVELKNERELAKIYKKLIDNKIKVSAVDHGISKSLYLEDPDGNGIEIYIDTRKQSKIQWTGRTTLLDTNKLLKLIKK